jgi:hypothetical protein
MKPLSFLAAAVLLTGLLATAARAGDLGDYLTKDGQFKHSLAFREGQMGFAGTTGTVWTIEPSGQWSVATFLNEKTLKTLRKGQLSEKQRRALAQHLASLELLALPEALSDFQGANPRVFNLRFGRHHSSLVTRAGQALSETVPPENLKETVAWTRFLAIGVLVMQWTNESTSSNEPQK